MTTAEAREKLAAATAQARKAIEEGASKEALELYMAELRSAESLLNEAQAAEAKKAEGEAGDALRQELTLAEQRDFNKGAIQYAGGFLKSPSRDALLASLSTREMIPDEVRHDPMSRLIHLPTNDPEIKALQQLNDQCIMVQVRMGKKWSELAATRELWNQHLTHFRDTNIINPGTSGSGSQWVPTYYSADLITDIYIEARVLDLFARFNMPRATCTVPRMLTEPTVYIASGATVPGDFWNPTSPVSEVTTSNVSFTADRIQIIMGYSEEAEEDVIVELAPTLRTAMVGAISRGLENAVINGSASLTDLDNADGTAANKLWAASAGTQDVRYAWNGLRKDAQVTNSNKVDAGGTGAFTIDDIINTKAKLGKYGTDAARDNCAWIVGVDAEAMMLGLDELITVDKYGATATIHRGEIGQLFGIPVVISGQVYGPNQGYGLNASGVWDNQTKTTTSALLVNRKAYMLGDRREIRVESERSIIGGMTFMVVSGRWDFQKMLASTAATSAVLYNMVP